MIALDKFFSSASAWETPTRGVENSGFGAAYELIHAIMTESISTSEEFDAALNERPNYNLQSGGRCDETVLSAAIVKENLPIIRNILKRDPTLVNAEWHNSKTPYIITAVSCDQIFEEFVARGANIHLASPDGKTALEFAASNLNKQKITRCLLEKGAVIYNVSRERILEDPRWCEKSKQEVREQKRNIKAALNLSPDCNMFLNGSLSLPSSKDQNPLTALPYDIREKIWSYLTLVQTPLSLQTRTKAFPNLHKNSKNHSLAY